MGSGVVLKGFGQGLGDRVAPEEIANTTAFATMGRMDNTQEHVTRLLARIAVLEVELALYATTYGPTERARELLKRPVE